MSVYYVLTFVILVNAHDHIQSPRIPPQVIPRGNIDQYGLALEAIFGMGIRLHVLLDSSKGNFVVSPISTTAVISQLMLGANGEFRDHLYELLSLSNKPLYSNNVNVYGKHNNNQTDTLPYSDFHLQLAALLTKLGIRRSEEQFTLYLNNTLFYNKDIKLKDQFKHWLCRLYGSNTEPLDFQKDTTRIINSWASKTTNGLINTVLSSPPPPSTTSIFLNSIYFRAEWETVFSSQLNRDDIFFVNENSTVNTTYMIGMLEQIPYAKTKRYRIVGVPYKNRELSLYVIYPNQDVDEKYDIKKFAQSLDPRELLESIGKMKNNDVVLKIPKLSLSNTISLLKPLQKYAEFKKANISEKIAAKNDVDVLLNRLDAYSNFTARAHPDLLLTDASEGVPLKVTDIVQQMVFSINEKGTEAAAVTAGITDYMGGVKSVILNRPFTFFIRHEETSATLFWGTVLDPSRS